VINYDLPYDIRDKKNTHLGILDVDVDESDDEHAFPKTTTVKSSKELAYDEYVHRIGRTGRVGNPGRSIAFYDETCDRYLVPFLVTGLKQAGQEIPSWLQKGAVALGGDAVDNNVRIFFFILGLILIAFSIF